MRHTDALRCDAQYGVRDAFDEFRARYEVGRNNRVALRIEIDDMVGKPRSLILTAMASATLGRRVPTSGLRGAFRRS